MKSTTRQSGKCLEKNIVHTLANSVTEMNQSDAHHVNSVTETNQ
jgi:hypothetical protein